MLFRSVSDKSSRHQPSLKEAEEHEEHEEHKSAQSFDHSIPAASNNRKLLSAKDSCDAKSCSVKKDDSCAKTDKQSDCSDDKDDHCEAEEEHTSKRSEGSWTSKDYSQQFKNSLKAPAKYVKAEAHSNK